MASPDEDLVGPFPSELRKVTTYVVAIPTSAQQPAAARELIAFLTSRQAVSTLQAKGFDPL